MLTERQIKAAEMYREGHAIKIIQFVTGVEGVRLYEALLELKTPKRTKAVRGLRAKVAAARKAARA